MDLGLNEAQQMLRTSAQEFLAAECPDTYVREMEQDERGYTPEMWRKIAEQGWLDRNEQIVIFNTGSGLKYNHLFPVPEVPVLDHNDPNVLDLVQGRG